MVFVDRDGVSRRLQWGWSSTTNRKFGRRWSSTFTGKVSERQKGGRRQPRGSLLDCGRPPSPRRWSSTNAGKVVDRHSTVIVAVHDPPVVGGRRPRREESSTAIKVVIDDRGIRLLMTAKYRFLVIYFFVAVVDRNGEGRRPARE